jgi:hypothetical protein
LYMEKQSNNANNKNLIVMKKTFLALLLAGSCGAAVAQVTQTTDSTKNQNQTQTQTQTMNQTQTNPNWNANVNTTTTIQGNQHKVHQNTMTTTGEYSAYGTTSATIPSTVQVYFDRDYPNAGAVTWRKKGDWYYATYNKMGRYNHVYYNERGDTYTVALPVTQNFVPDDIVMKVGNMFGDMVYDIATIKGQNGQNIYHIRTIEGDQLKSNWVGEDGATIADPFRPADSLQLQQNMNTDVNTSTNTINQTEQTTTDTTTINTTKDSTQQSAPDNSPVPDPGSNNQDGSRNNNNPENQSQTHDYAILTQVNALRKKA